MQFTISDAMRACLGDHPWYSEEDNIMGTGNEDSNDEETNDGK